jgi:uncharacterized protein (DUF3084 family)
MIPFVLQVVLLLLVIGGVIAYIGNYVGRYIGKKRLTVFNLRPRHTATAITIISGILIAVSTLAVLLIISQDARTALLGLESLKKEINQKSLELEQNRRELARLEKQQGVLKQGLAELQRAKQSLQKKVEVSQKGQVLFRVNQVISVSLLQAGPEKDKLEAGLKGILTSADNYIRSLGVKGDKHLIYMAPDDFEQTFYSLLGQNKLFIVKLVATRNVLWGEEIPAQFETADNRLIYRADEEIAGRDLPKGLAAPQIEQEVMDTLKAAHNSAREAGILPDPTGSMGAIPYSQIFELAKKIKSLNRSIRLKVLSAKAIYTIGPLEVKFKLDYK